MAIRVLLAEDHQLFRDALRALIEHEPDIQIVAEVGDGLRLLSLVRTTTPDVVCVDIGLPGLNGIEATRRVRQISPGSQVIALSAYTEKHFVLDMLAAGASGYVAKASAAPELLRAIRAVHDGRRHLCPMIAATVAEAMLNGEEADSTPAARLSARERQVLQLVAEGHTSPQIGERLHLAPATVDVHRRNIMRKLGLRSIADLTRFAVRHGIASS